MQAEYDGRQIVGIDLHRRRSMIVRTSEAGDSYSSRAHFPIGLDCSSPTTSSKQSARSSC
ncbi:hypothetical protein EEZ25_33180 [Micromonospora aurantiaca]|uniref:hypothetical protein n=1 Tax=Micromonospora aurantiaca (nom. illeg.) TaxID=47850 RepID=UPI000F41A477|nr:hypothetical protein [Micromonospora aurantiaca]RNH93519.1 hypothetical protein EEZ25_33180 [Micromonospora aurantiaca]